MMGLRLLILVAVVAAGFGAVWLAGRLGRRSRVAGLPSGLTVVTGPDCRWCDRLVTALTQRRSGELVNLIDARAAADAGITVRSVPTAVVVGADGHVVLRRSGPAAIDDLDRLLAAARAVRYRPPARR